MKNSTIHNKVFAKKLPQEIQSMNLIEQINSQKNQN